MNENKWIEYYRELKPFKHMNCLTEAFVLDNLEHCINIVQPDDADKIKMHVKKMIEISTWDY